MYEIVIGRSEKDRLKYGTEGAIFLGKHYVKMGQATSLSNNIYMDITRSHVVFVCGKRGSGKCLTGDTLITLENGLEVPVKDLCETNDRVFGLDQDLKIKPFARTEFFQREVDEIIKVKLKSGKEIKLTSEHPLLSIDGWKECRELKIGSRIATPRIIRCNYKEKMEDHEIKVLAYLIAEGHVKKHLTFSNYDKVLVEDLRDSLLRMEPFMELVELRKGCYRINSRNIKRKVNGYPINRDKTGRFGKGSSINHEKMRQSLEADNIHGLLPAQKFIPKRIFTTHKEGIKLFLNRLFSCDGSIYKKSNKPYWEISYASSSERLIKEVQSLLLRFNILSKSRVKEIKCNLFQTFELVLNGESVITFIREIGFFGTKKDKEAIALKDMEAIRKNTNVDTIPKEIWNNYRPKSWSDVGKTFGYKTPKALRSSIAYSPSRQKLLQIAIADQNERLRCLAQSDIFWDEIVYMEKIEGKFPVYDITVPEAHNFIANNIIVHNSYTMGVIAEGMSDIPPEIRDNIAIIMLDTMGIYWTMKYPNDKEEELLKEWNLAGKALDTVIYTPTGYYKKYKEEGVPTDKPFSIKPSELDASDWCSTFEIGITTEEGVLIESIINDLRDTVKDFDIGEVIDAVNNYGRAKQETKNAVINRFLDSKRWGIFSREGTPLNELVKGGQVTVLDVGCYATIPGTQGLRALVIGLIAEKLFVQRMIARKNEEIR